MHTTEKKKKKVEQDKKDKQHKDSKTKKASNKRSCLEGNSKTQSRKRSTRQKINQLLLKTHQKEVEESTEANFIETQYVKLTGPIVSGEKN